MDGQGYPLYRRPDDGRAYEVGGRLVDNRWIVLYSPFLCGLFDCHINVECVCFLPWDIQICLQVYPEGS